MHARRDGLQFLRPDCIQPSHRQGHHPARHDRPHPGPRRPRHRHPPHHRGRPRWRLHLRPPVQRCPRAHAPAALRPPADALTVLLPKILRRRRLLALFHRPRRRRADARLVDSVGLETSPRRHRLQPRHVHRGLAPRALCATPLAHDAVRSPHFRPPRQRRGRRAQGPRSKNAQRRRRGHRRPQRRPRLRPRSHDERTLRRQTRRARPDCRARRPLHLRPRTLRQRRHLRPPDFRARPRRLDGLQGLDLRRWPRRLLHGLHLALRLTLLPRAILRLPHQLRRRPGAHRGSAQREIRRARCTRRP